MTLTFNRDKIVEEKKYFYTYTNLFFESSF